MRKIAAAVALLAGLGLVVAGACFAEEAKKPAGPLKVGDMVEKVKVQDLEGNTVDLSASGGKPTAIVFFNSSCSACRAEMGVLNKLAKSNEGLKVKAVCTDANGAKGVERFLKMTKMNKFEYFVDAEFEAAGRFGFSYTPALVLADEGGKIYFSKGGYMNSDEEELVAQVNGSE